MKKIALVVLLAVFAGSCKSDVTSLPKEFYGSVIRGKTDYVDGMGMVLRRRYYISMMTKDSTLVCIQVPKIMYVTYEKGDTVK